MVNPDWLDFSEFECQILLPLCERGPLTARAIGAALDRSPDGTLKEILANLVSRKVLVTGQDGYTFNGSAAQKAELHAKLKTQCGQTCAE